MENNAKTCPNCGQYIANIAVICPNCKYDFLADTSVQSQQPTNEQEISTCVDKPPQKYSLLNDVSEEINEMIQVHKQKRLAKKQLAKEQSMQTHMPLEIFEGFQQIHTSAKTVMYQRPDGSVYFNKNINEAYILLNYYWDGPRFDTFAKTVSHTSTTTKTKGRAGKVTAGALLGTLLMPGIGTAVGAAAGASGKQKSNSFSSNVSNTKYESRELIIPATLYLKNLNTGEYINLVISCHTAVDSQIKYFRFFTEQRTSNNSQNFSQIKELKELLDMGAITQEEFEAKKQQLLNS